MQPFLSFSTVFSDETICKMNSNRAHFNGYLNSSFKPDLNGKFQSPVSNLREQH